MQMPEPASPEAIARLAEDFVANRVYSLEDVPENLIQMVFMPLAIGNPFADMSEEQIQQLFVFAVYGRDKSSQMGVNGWPIFFSMQVWRRVDAIEALERAKAVAEILSGGKA